MDPHRVPCKTDLGRRALQGRDFPGTRAQRMFLIMADGRTPMSELSAAAAQLRVDEQALQAARATSGPRSSCSAWRRCCRPRRTSPSRTRRPALSCDEHAHAARFMVTMRRVQPAKSPVTDLIATQRLVAHFQPIVDLHSGTVHAHEALIRGPAGTPLATPDALFAAARAERCEVALELECVRRALAAWAGHDVPGKLFINMSAHALTAALSEPEFDDAFSRLSSAGVSAASIVIELTERHVPASLRFHHGHLRHRVVPLGRRGRAAAHDLMQMRQSTSDSYAACREAPSETEPVISVASNREDSSGAAEIVRDPTAEPETSPSTLPATAPPDH
jgi:hypothetical protein